MLRLYFPLVTCCNYRKQRQEIVWINVVVLMKVQSEKVSWDRYVLPPFVFFSERMGFIFSVFIMWCLLQFCYTLQIGSISIYSSCARLFFIKSRHVFYLPWSEYSNVRLDAFVCWKLFDKNKNSDFVAEYVCMNKFVYILDN